LFSDSWLESSAFSHFIEKVQQLTKPSASQHRGFLFYFLDAENLKLDINTETFLARLCKYPLKSRLLPTGKSQHWQAGCRTL